MSNKHGGYAMPIDDEEIEGGDEIVDIEDDYSDEDQNIDEEKENTDKNQAMPFMDDKQADESDEGVEEESVQDEEDEVAHQTGPNLNRRGLDGPGYEMPDQPKSSFNKMRPQSAKTAIPAVDRFQQPNNAAHNQNWGQNALHQGAQGYSQQALNGQQMQQPLMGYQQPNFFYPQQQQMSQQPSVASRMPKRRPGTASRKNGTKGSKVGLPPTGSLVGGKSSTILDADVSKLRPRVVHQERERLYDDVMKQRMTTNHFKDENTKLKTRLFFIEQELGKKDKIIDDLMAQQDHMHDGFRMGGRGVSGKLNFEPHLVINLKRKVKEMTMQHQQKNDEIESLKRNIKSTRLQEQEVETKLYMEECARLRHQLEEVIRSKDTFADPQELKIIEEKFQQRDMVIQQMQHENAEFLAAVQKKDEENRQLAELVQEMERRMKKAIAASKSATKYKTQVTHKDREIRRKDKEIEQLAGQNKSLLAQIEELRSASKNVQSRPARVQSAYPPSSGGVQQTAEIKRLKDEVAAQKRTVETQLASIKKLQANLGKKEEEIAVLQQDRERFKNLSEKYMNDVAQLEAQFDAVDLKPKSKMSQRPKDTVKRGQSASHGTINAQKLKRVEIGQLMDTCRLLKLMLQKRKLPQDDIPDLLFDDYNPTASISIAQLIGIFEKLGVNAKKAVLLSRYLVEPQDQVEITYNENLSIAAGEVIELLEDMLCPYSLFDDKADQLKMARIVGDKFTRCRDTLVEALECEDYDEQGLLDLCQLREAINSVFEDLDEEIMDFMLLYVYERSENDQQMQYRHIIKMVDENNNQRAQSATKKNRPESSSPDKLKQRNPSAKARVITDNLRGEDSSDKYEDEDIHIEQDDDDEYSKEFEGLKDINELQDQKNLEEFDESPKITSNREYDQPAQPQQEESEAYTEHEDDEKVAKIDEEEDDPEETEMIDVAEQVFIRIAEALVQNQLTIRQVFGQHLLQAEIDTHVVETLQPLGLLEGIKSIGITDLSEKEVKYLLKILSKEELDGLIVFAELSQIMENFGLNDDGPTYEGNLQDNQDAPSDEEPDHAKPGQLQRDAQQNVQRQSTKGKPLDLSLLDQKSVKIMVMLMLFLIDNNLSTKEFFEEVTYLQDVQGQSTKKTYELINAEDFFAYLHEAGIRSKPDIHQNLSQFLSLSPQHSNLIMLKKVKQCLEQMGENEDFMQAIEEDFAAQQEELDYGEELARIARGESMKRPTEQMNALGSNPNELGVVEEHSTSQAPQVEDNQAAPVEEDEGDNYSSDGSEF